ncbi:hypothetical protein CP082626L3_0492 [Chlamydia psittaci 08-2626_L3]|nr:hypothetical protein CP082626L3_0492 [Chlamydia psittaci 08-2626_L3]
MGDLRYPKPIIKIIKSQGDCVGKSKGEPCPELGRGEIFRKRP